MFITIEGIDGSGKTTQAGKLAAWLEAHTGRETIRTAEPYILRDLILGSKKLCSEADLLLFLADRAQHVHDVILPALNAGANIICERYNESTLAYQDNPRLNELIALCDFPEPDVKIFLDISPETAFTRVKARGNVNDKFESQGLELMRRVSERYRKLACENRPLQAECGVPVRLRRIKSTCGKFFTLTKHKFVPVHLSRIKLTKITCDDLDESQVFAEILECVQSR